MRRWILSLIPLLLIGQLARAEEAVTRILLIGKDRDHPYATHEYMTDCKILAKCLEQTPGVKTIVSNGWPTDPAMRENIKAIVLHTQKGGDVLLGSRARKDVEKLLQSGVGLTAIHWSTGASKDVGDAWTKTLGGWFDRGIGSRLSITQTGLLQADPSHPICRGWKSYPLRDEYYLDLRFQPDIHPVLQVHIGDKDHTVGWTYERPDSKAGRSFGFVCGHFHANFGEAAFRQAIVNGILWTAHLDVPARGAPVMIAPKDMELPPREKK